MIEIKGLTKKFNGLTAVDNVSFNVGKGELLGLLGPNGAGKTTIINMLSTLIRPTSGSATLNGYDILNERDEVRNNIGIVFQIPALDNQLTGMENLTFHAMMYGLSKAERKKRINELLELVDLSDRADTLVYKYSGGMMRRLELARGLIHKPKVLFLDEPTLGLDAQTRHVIWDYIKKLNHREKVTIILTTHYMDEADFLCDRVAIIDNGKIIALDQPSKLKDSLGGGTITVETESGKVDKMIKLLNFKWLNKIKQRGNNLILNVSKGESRIPLIVNSANKCGVKLKSVSLRKPTLEDVFIHFTGKAIHDEEMSNTERLRMRFMRGGMHGRA